VVETPEGNGEVFAYGDRVIAARRRDGTGIDYIVIECSKNAPTYLSYLIKDAPAEGAERPLQVFQRLGGGVRTQISYGPDHDPIKSVDTFWTTVGTLAKMDFLDKEGSTKDYGLHWVFDHRKYDVVVVMSDGAESFQRREGTRLVTIPVKEVIDHVFALKNTTPGFLQRRLKRFLTKFCVQNGWQHNDDFAVGGIVLEDIS